MGLVSTTGLKRAPAQTDSLKSVTVRDFSGLWNTSDNDLNLKSKYQSVLTNIERATDGSLKVRYGRQTFADVAHPRSSGTSVTVHGQVGVSQVQVTWAGHGLGLGSRVRLVGLPTGTYMGLPETVFTDYLPVVGPFTADTFYLLLPSYTSAPAADIQSVVEEQAAVGELIDVEYFEDFLVGVTDAGYVVSVDGTAAVRTLWSPTIGLFQTMTQQVLTAVLTTTATKATLTVDCRVTPPPVAVGSLIRLSDYPAVGGIPAAEINSYHTVIATSGTTYTLAVNTPATLNDSSSAGTLYFSVSTAWHSSFFCSHAVFNRQLILCNGIDKPLMVDFALDPVCQFLTDPDTQSNINTPIGLYICAGDNYVVIGGNALEPAKIWISAQNTNCVFTGDPAPNDATTVDVGKLVNSPSPAMTGMTFHKGLLFVGFENHFVILQLGNYDADGNHLPAKQDVISNYGTVSHKSLMSVGDNFYGCDYTGVLDVTRNLLTQTFKPTRASEPIGPHLSRTLSYLTVNQASFQTWSVYDRREGRYWLFVPKPGGGMYAYVYYNQEERKIKGWQLFVDLDFTCGCRSEFDRVFGCKGTVIYRMGNDTDPVYTDDGQPIRFVWETPWSDFSTKVLKKRSRYLKLDTSGNATFTASLYVDRIYDDVQALATTPPETIYDHFDYPTTPDIAVRYVAGNGVGYGGGTQPYGGGRRTSRAGLVGFPSEFELAKLRFEGSVSGPLRFIGFSIMYLVGSIRR